MSALRFRAWRFLYPGLDAPEPLSGLQVSAQGGLGMVAEHEAVRQAILLLLSTVPGERVMHPDYGCHIHRLVFAPNDESTAGLAIHYVRSALQRWEPRIDILRVDAERNAEFPERLDILLDYRVVATQQTQQLTFAMNLRGEET